jgi:glycerol-3-phosphate acyltransferase PlsY
VHKQEILFKGLEEITNRSLNVFRLFRILIAKNSTIRQSPRLLPYILSLSLGYLIGSFPTAYVLLKWNAQLDIRTAGSGNVGAMNAFDVTGSKWMGTTVMVLDMLKGAAAAGMCWILWKPNIEVVGVGSIASVIGHDFPVWLKFKGGRGLSTSAGVMMVLGWIFVVVWCSLWAISYLGSKHIHGSNMIASLLSPLLILFVPKYWIEMTLPSFMSYSLILYLTIAICSLIMLRHIDSVLTLWNSFTQQSL